MPASSRCSPLEVDVNALVLEAAKLLHPTLGENVEITPLLAEDAWTALVDPNQLSTAVLNLALNARDAMPNGGKLALETSNIYLDENYAGMHSEVTPGHYVMVAVSDTGTGIPAALIERVFDPFFTTKEVGKGTGLGLSMVFGFVKQSGGHIKIYSEEGHGTSVKMYLPRATGLNQTAAEAAISANVEGGTETVLVVEDDSLVRRYVMTQIESLGYTTLRGGQCQRGLADHRCRAGPRICCSPTSSCPANMNGRQLVDEALKRRPIAEDPVHVRIYRERHRSSRPPRFRRAAAGKALSQIRTRQDAADWRLAVEAFLTADISARITRHRWPQSVRT